jgi:hypothetical protein
VCACVHVHGNAQVCMEHTDMDTRAEGDICVKRAWLFEADKSIASLTLTLFHLTGILLLSNV